MGPVESGTQTATSDSSLSQLQTDSSSMDTAVETATHKVTGIEKDSDVVDWDGTDDIENPQNWSVQRKSVVTGIVILLILNITAASSAPSTSVGEIGREFGTTKEVSYLVTSTFLFGYVVGPMLWSGLSETYGRRPVFLGTVLVYTLFILGQTLAKNITTFLVTRWLAGVFASAPLSNGGGVIADIWGPVGRGRAVALFTSGFLLGPVLGPVIAGFVTSSHLGWRWVFWLLMIISGTFWLISVFFLPETFGPTILAKKVERLKKSDPIGNAGKITSYQKNVNHSFRGILDRTIFKPFIMLSLEPILVLFTLYAAVVYGIVFALFEIFPIVFIEVRGMKPEIAGLTFLGFGIGTTLAAPFSLWMSSNYGQQVTKWRGFPPPEERLYDGIVGAPIFVVAIFWMGWTGAYKSVPWYVVDLAAIPMGFSVCLLFISNQSYIVDTYLMHAASGLAGSAILRSASGAIFPLVTNQMYHNLGIQWASTLLGLLSLLLAPIPFVFWKWGPDIRKRSKFAPCPDLKIRDEVLGLENLKEKREEYAD